ncbi:Hypothetical predicted protein, partial [Paramuricea clavata]
MVTRPPAPWMKDLSIRSLQSQRDVYRCNAHHTGSESDWQIFRKVRNQLIKVIKETRKLFYYNACPLKDLSTIHRILQPNPRPIDPDPEKLNNHFANIAERLTGRESKSYEELNQIINNMPCVTGDEFQLRNVTYSEVKMELLRIRKDCSSGYDNIPMRLIQPVIEDTVSPLTHIINSCIKNNIFPQTWKVSRISPIQKQIILLKITTIVLWLFCLYCQKFTKAWYYDKCKNLLTGSKLPNCTNADPKDYCLENRPPYISMPEQYYAFENSVFQLEFNATDPEGYPIQYRSYLRNKTVSSVLVDRKRIKISVKKSGRVSLKVRDYGGLAYIHTIKVVTISCRCKNG